MDTTSLTITLPAPLRSYVDNRVAEGGHGSADAYIQALIAEDQQRRSASVLETLLSRGLDQLPPEEREQERARRSAHLRQLIAEGLEELDQGKGIPGEEVFQRLRERNRQAVQAAKLRKR